VLVNGYSQKECEVGINEARYRIGCQASQIMKSQAVEVRDIVLEMEVWVQRKAENNPLIREAWVRNSVGKLRTSPGMFIHALQCYIPGTCASTELRLPWQSLINDKPFYLIPQSVLALSLDDEPGFEWGGKICDYFARMQPDQFKEGVIDSYKALRTDDERRAFLRTLLPTA
jgi:hypothetical protein